MQSNFKVVGEGMLASRITFSKPDFSPLSAIAKPAKIALRKVSE